MLNARDVQKDRYVAHLKTAWKDRDTDMQDMQVTRAVAKGHGMREEGRDEACGDCDRQRWVDLDAGRCCRACRERDSMGSLIDGAGLNSSIGVFIL